MTLFALALLAAAPGVPAAASADDQGAPKAVVAEPIHDFGDVQKGDKLNHSFVIANQGGKALEITRVSPTCGCTVANFDRTIPPGGTGKIHAAVDTRTLGGPTAKSITVFTNDPDNPRIQLTFKANVEVQLRAHPGYARYITVRGEEEPGVLKQVIWAEDARDFDIVGVDSPFPHLETSFRPAREEERQEEGEGKQWIVEMTLHYNDAPLGPIADNLVIRTNHPRQKELLIPISGFVRPGMWVTPDKVDLGKVKLDGEPVEFSLTLQNFLSTPLEVTGVESTLQGIEAKISPIQEGRKFSVEVTLKPGLPPGSFDGKLLIQTNTLAKPVVEVPIRGTVL